MRNLFAPNRASQAWFDYLLDIIFILCLFLNGERALAWLFILLTLVDFVLLALFPKVEDMLWYRVISLVIIVIMIIYVLLSLMRLLAGDQVLQGLNLPLN